MSGCQMAMSSTRGAMQRLGKCASTDGCEPIDREQQRRMAGLLLSALRVPRVYQLLIDICCRRPRSAANAGGSVMLRAEGREAQYSLILDDSHADSD